MEIGGDRRLIVGAAVSDEVAYLFRVSISNRELGNWSEREADDGWGNIILYFKEEDEEGGKKETKKEKERQEKKEGWMDQ